MHELSIDSTEEIRSNKSEMASLLLKLDEKDAEIKSAKDRLKKMSAFVRHTANCKEWSKIDACDCGLLGILRG